MNEETKKQTQSDALKQSTKDVMWEEHRVTTFLGPSDMTDWEFTEEPPYIAPSRSGLQVVVPTRISNGVEVDFMEAGISFLSLIESYAEVFINLNTFDEEELSLEKSRVLQVLMRSIAIIKSKE